MACQPQGEQLFLPLDACSAAVSGKRHIEIDKNASGGDQHQAYTMMEGL